MNLTNNAILSSISVSYNVGGILGETKWFSTPYIVGVLQNPRHNTNNSRA